MSIVAARAAVVTATPDERSNSSPIMSSPTATAMMPIVELAYRTVAIASAERNDGATTMNFRPWWRAAMAS